MEAYRTDQLAPVPLASSCWNVDSNPYVTGLSLNPYVILSFLVRWAEETDVIAPSKNTSLAGTPRLQKEDRLPQQSKLDRRLPRDGSAVGPEVSGGRGLKIPCEPLTCSCLMQAF